MEHTTNTDGLEIRKHAQGKRRRTKYAAAARALRRGANARTRMRERALAGNDVARKWCDNKGVRWASGSI